MKKNSILFILSLTSLVILNGCTYTKKAANDKVVSVEVTAPNTKENSNNNTSNTTAQENKTDKTENLTITASKKTVTPPVYKKGDNGLKIKEIQQKLNKFGYKLIVDGDFGPSTYNAVLDFQRRNKIKADGIVSTVTLKKLDQKPTKATMYQPPVVKPSTSANGSAEKIVNSKGFSSSTKYFIWIDFKKQKVHIFTGSKGKWKLIKSMVCSSGKPSTPTIKGIFTVGSKGGYFIADGGARCKYYTQIKGNYLFHSVLYNNKGTKIIDGRLGIPLSHGCVRLAPQNAKYIYDNIPRGTKIWSS